MQKKRVLVGLSGGVDSAVTVKLLIESGYDVAGLYLDMKNSDTDEPLLIERADNECDDIKSAHQCALKYGIPLYKFGAASLFDSIVKEDFAHQYSLGRTPNPCVICNRLVKFALLEKCADMLGCEILRGIPFFHTLLSL